MAKWLLHVLSKYIYDLFNVFRRKWLILVYTDFKKSITRRVLDMHSPVGQKQLKMNDNVVL